MRVEIRQLQRANGTTSVYVTHDQEEAFSISDRVAIMNAGRIMQFDTPEVLYQRPDNAFVARFVGFENLIPMRVSSARRRRTSTAEARRQRRSAVWPGAVRADPRRFRAGNAAPTAWRSPPTRRPRACPRRLASEPISAAPISISARRRPVALIANGPLSTPLDIGAEAQAGAGAGPMLRPEAGADADAGADHQRFVLPIDTEMTGHRRAAMCISRATTIVAVGAGAPPDLAGAEIVDAGGDIVMPGMVNPHCHMAHDAVPRPRRGCRRPAATATCCRWSGNSSPPEMVRVGTRLAALELIEAGVTTVADMYYFETEVGRVVDEAGLPRRGRPDHRRLRPARPQDDRRRLRADRAAAWPSSPAIGRVIPSIAPHAPYSTDIAVMNRVARWADDHPDAPVQIHLAEMD